MCDNAEQRVELGFLELSLASYTTLDTFIPQMCDFRKMLFYDTWITLVFIGTYARFVINKWGK